MLNQQQPQPLPEHTSSIHKKGKSFKPARLRYAFGGLDFYEQGNIDVICLFVTNYNAHSFHLLSY